MFNIKSTKFEVHVKLPKYLSNSPLKEDSVIHPPIYNLSSEIFQLLGLGV
jgi:hypothetical protein